MKAIIFDFDGTLADTIPNIVHSFSEVFNKYDGADLSREEIIGMFGPSETEIIEQNLKSDQKKEAKEDYFKEYEDRHAEFIQKNEEIKDVLRKLQERDIKLGVVTGKSKRGLSITLKELGMESFFQAVVTGDDVDQPKPSPEGIEMALKELQTAKSETIYAGDSDSDIKAGIKAGLKTCGVKWLPNTETSEFEHTPDIILENTSDWEKLLA
ncbi:HAD family hydrolase [Metabacillus sp. GX 13764]|uniref:HAD family hydrolase n=1 Tax=Metabacillus kandeliae TaxID=2900151 RepID=UPI001E3C52BA|nr:HAD family hydrolase [Metabacillus kandeliae]MCD7033634.1 HAD family hydrolase [Metabacillus kandeliae]